jgi:subtilase family serine protease
MIPLTTAVPASYRIIAVADALERQAELDEGNNTLVSTGKVAITLYRPELSVTALTMPATGATARPLAITSAIRNGGPAPAGAFTVRFYLSTDTTLDGGDVLLGSRAIAGLAAGATSTAVTTFMVPIATSAGDYHVIAVVDALERQAELDEGNNTFVSPTTVAIALFRSDLVLTALSVPPTGGAAGRPLAITNAVRNLGPAPAGAFTVRFYLSADGVQDASDVLLGSRVIGSLAANASSSTVTSLVIPATTPVPASYRVIAVVDALGQQTEMEEGNNTMMTDPVPIRAYRPDLTLESISAPAAVTAGRSLTITHVTRNDGTAPTAGGFTVRFYLSTDGTRDDADTLLGTRALPALAAGGRRTDVTVVTVPAGLAPGTYQILGVVDALGQQTELNEDNNLSASGSVTVTSPS